MKKNFKNLVILFLSCPLFVLGCGTYKSIGDPDAPKVERGRLKFAKKVTNITLGPEPIYRNVEQDFYVNGKKWSPAGDPKFADKINWCDTSPNPKVEILRCFGNASEDYKTTYILRMKNDVPEIQKINEGLPSIWINDDGRWLLLKKFYLNVETGEKIDIKVVPLPGQTAEVLPSFVVGVSPDMKTIIELPDNMSKKEGAEEFLKLWILDIETGKTDERKISFTKNPWLTDHKNPEDDIQFPPVTSKKFGWAKDANGRDRLISPQFSETAGKK